MIEPVWIYDLFRHLRLAVGFERCAQALEPTQKVFAEEVRKSVLDPLARVGFFPQFTVLLKELAKKPRDDLFWTVAQNQFLAGWPVAGGTLDQAEEILIKSLKHIGPNPASGSIRTPLWPEWFDAPTLWVGLAQGLEGWLDLAPRIRELCDVAEDARGYGAAVATYVESVGRTGQDPKLLALLKATATVLNSHSPCPPASTLELVAAVKEVRKIVVSAPDGWPPILIRNLLRKAADSGAVLDIRATDATLPAVEPAVASCVQLAISLVDAADRLGARVPDPVWVAIRGMVDGLGKSAGWCVELVREHRQSEFDEVPEPERSASVVAVSAVVVSKAGKRIWVRRGEIRAPLPSPPVTAALRTAARTTEADDPGFAKLCAEIERMSGDANLSDPTWWEARAIEELGVWWRLTARAGLLPGRLANAGADLLRALAGVGIEPTPYLGDGVPCGPWFLTTGKGDAPTTTRCGIRFPDGRVIAPAVWVRIVGPDRPEAQCLAGCESLVAALRANDPDWRGWAIYNEAVWRVAYGGGSTTVGAVINAFEATYLRSLEVATPHLAGYQLLAGQLYRCLIQKRCVLIPALNPDTLTPALLAEQPTDGTKISWVAGGRLGEVLRVLRFCRPGQPAELEVAAGPNREGLLAWLRLKAPPDGPLRTWAAAAAGLIWSPDRETAVTQSHKAKVVEWVQKEGLSWFARAAPDDPWVRALVAAKWCRCYPELGDTHHPVRWPADTAPAPTTRWQFSDPAVVPVRVLLRDPVFAPRADQAGGAFSLGPKADASPALCAAAGLAAAAPDVGPIRKIWNREVAVHLKAATEADIGTLASNLIECLPQMSPQIVSPARQWCEARGLELLGKEFAESDPMPRFHKDLDVGTRWVERYGIRGSSVSTIQPVILVSAGPEPAHLPALQAAIERLPAGIDSSRLREAVAQWPGEALNQDLRYSVGYVYGIAWEIARGEPVPKALIPIMETLTKMLADGFKISEFRPNWLRDYDEDWVQYDRFRVPDTGRVVRIRRPGLESDGTLVSPAYVEVE